MNNRILFISIFFISILSILLIPVSSAQVPYQPLGDEAFQVLSQFFEYDRGIPLDLRIASKEDMGFADREKIVFTSANNERVPGYLAIPKTADKPYPIVLMLHGLGHEKESWWDGETYCNGLLLTKELLEEGYAVMMLDAYYFGERMNRNDYEHPRVFVFEKQWVYRLNFSIVQTIKDYRRAMDYLGTRPEIDTGRIGVVGYSMGGITTFILSGLDARIKTSVASVTPPLALKSPEMKYAATAPENFAPRFGSRPFLMLMATEDDNYSPEQGQQLYELIKSPAKEIKWYNSSHSLPPEWTGEAIIWIKKHL
jgi:dienelactone hydrolase